jgi:hypothetical protein
LKVFIAALTLSFLWHGIFIFVIEPEIFKIEPTPVMPRIKFWGEVFQVIYPRSQKEISDREEAAFLEQLFESDITANMALKTPFKAFYQPILSLNKSPDIKSTDLKRRNVSEYILVSAVEVGNLSYYVEINDRSQPVMVLADIMSGDFIQDSENWMKVKTGLFYSPAKKEIAFVGAGQ